MAADLAYDQRVLHAVPAQSAPGGFAQARGLNAGLVWLSKVMMMKELMDIQYTRGRISEALFHLVTAAEPMPQRAWDGYMIATQGAARDGFEAEYRALDPIFGNIRHDDWSEMPPARNARAAPTSWCKCFRDRGLS